MTGRSARGGHRTESDLEQLIEIGIALTEERDLSVLLARLVAEARRFTTAEAGTLLLKDGAAWPATSPAPAR